MAPAVVAVTASNAAVAPRLIKRVKLFISFLLTSELSMQWLNTGLSTSLQDLPKLNASVSFRHINFRRINFVKPLTGHAGM
jgi:hypothetical protein